MSQPKELAPELQRLRNAMNLCIVAYNERHKAKHGFYDPRLTPLAPILREHKSVAPVGWPEPEETDADSRG